MNPSHSGFAYSLRNSVLRWLGLLAALGAFTWISRASIVISEIHYHPVENAAFNTDGTPVLDLSNDVHEFIELQNTGSAPVDLSGWTLSSGVRFTFPSNTVIASGAFRVIARVPARLAAVYGLVASEVLGPYSGTLSNSGDTVRLRDASGATVDSVSYSSRFPWAQSADALGVQDVFSGLDSEAFQYKGRSLQRVSATWASNDPANWLASPVSGPTPGAAQAVTREVPAPVVIAQSAVQSTDGTLPVRAGVGVTVNCTWSGAQSLSNVQLEYFKDDVNSTSEERVLVSMKSLGGGRYTAEIPGQSDRTIVRYRFRADRGSGSEAVSPRSDDPQIAPTGPSGALEAWFGYFVTPVRTTSNAAIYDVMVSTAGLTRMASNVSQNPKRVTAGSAAGLPRDTPYVAASAPQWNGTVPGVFASDGQVWDIQIRYHGSRYHRASSNLSYKLHFPDHQPFNGQTSWFETLHGTEFIEAQKLNRLVGLPASRMRRVDWYLNSSANLVHSEQGEYAGEMLDLWHELQQQLNPGSEREETGELYKDVGNRDASQNNLEGPFTRGDEAPLAANSSWTQLQRYDWTFTLQNHSWKGPAPIRDLIEGMWAARGDSPTTHNFADDAAKLARTRAWFTNNWGIETTLTSMALLEWMSIWDDAAQNHFFWRRANGKWSRLGWDYDGVLGGSGTGGGGGPGGGGGGPGGGATQTIWGGEYGATTVFDGVNWWKDTFYKCFRSEYKQRLWELNNSVLDPVNLTALGLTQATTFAKTRQASVNSQLGSMGTYTRPDRPVSLFPADGAAIAGTTNLVTSAYTHPSGVAHAATRWEIRTASGTYEEPLVRETSTNALTAFAIPVDRLTYGQTYYWQAVHLDEAGHPSNVSAETKFTWGLSAVASGLVVLNEILANNAGAVATDWGTPDYIELRNNGSTDASVGGLSLTDEVSNPSKYLIPAGTTIPAGGQVVFWCDSATNAAGFHTGFRLNAEGQTVLLMSGSTILDSVQFGLQAANVAVGRIANGTGGWQANSPTPGAANSALATGPVTALRINEWMANPAVGDDWFELYNTDDRVVPLSGLMLSDTPSRPAITQLAPLSFIEARGFRRFHADGTSGGQTHANFKLDASGDTLLITAANGITMLDQVRFNAQDRDISEGRFPDGADTTARFSGQTASPGEANWIESQVVIQEVLPRATAPKEAAVELYNTGASAVNLGGWWLSDDAAVPRKYRIPDGTQIAAHGYWVVYASALASGSVPFAVKPAKGTVVLSAADSAGSLTGFGARAEWGVVAQNVSVGRVAALGLDSASQGVAWWPLVSTTFGRDDASTVAQFRTGSGAANSSPRVGPVVINELHYHPASQGTAVEEFIELLNLSTASVELGGWRLSGDVSFSIPTGTRLAAGATLLVVPFDPADTAAKAAFTTAYGVSQGVSILGPYSPHLPNDSGTVMLGAPDTLEGAAVFRTVDTVTYLDQGAWPVAADGSGASLQRVDLTSIGASASAWVAAATSAGAINAAQSGGVQSAPVLTLGRSASGDWIGTVTLKSDAGATCVIQFSADLQTWETLTTVAASGSAVSWSDPASGNRVRYYRAVVNP